MTPVARRLRSTPPWLWLAGIVLLSIAVRIAIVRRSVAPWIMVDELIYSELARSFAADARFLVRGVPSTGYGFVYPVLIAPAFKIAALPKAYAAAKAINAVVMSLTAVPTYLLARRLLSAGLSLAAAALAVLIPPMLYTGTLMTENAFYPLFVLATLVLVLMLERPTWQRQVLVLAVCALAFATRAQAVALFGAALVAPIVHGLIEQDLRHRLRRYVTLYGLTVCGALLALAGTVARGRSPLTLLGAYRAATDHRYSVTDIARYLLWHTAELDLSLGVIGIAALIAMWLAPRSQSAGARAYAAATLPVTVLLLVEVATFASRQSFRIEERNDFYLAPFALIALLGLASRDDVVARVPRVLVTAALIAGLLPVAIPFARFVNPSAVSDTFGLLPWWWLQDRGIHFGPLRFVALAVGLAAAAFVFVPRRFALVAPALVAVYFVLASAIVENGRHGIRQTSVGGLWAGIRVPHRDWIDRSVGRHANVAFLWHYAGGDTRPLWNNEIFNRSVGTIYTVDGPDPADGGLPETPVRQAADGRVLTSAGRVPRVRYVVSYTDLAGVRLARDPKIGLGLYRVDGPLLILTRVTGLYPDTWSRRRVTYSRFECTGGQLTVRLGTDARLFKQSQVVTAMENGHVVGTVRIGPTEQPTFGLRLTPDSRQTCTVAFTVATLRSPAGVQPGSDDTRNLGAHFYSFEYAK